ncbi:MAG: hypothetical protein DRR19_27925 [Candidatus Parabeggiatoa sp. nov. 1]|nr:MAG: hypothetical protein DRR19_27925 [Gammaproteobacteria bacterium]
MLRGSGLFHLLLKNLPPSSNNSKHLQILPQLTTYRAAKRTSSNLQLITRQQQPTMMRKVIII